MYVSIGLQYWCYANMHFQIQIVNIEECQEDFWKGGLLYGTRALRQSELALNPGQS